MTHNPYSHPASGNVNVLSAMAYGGSTMVDQSTHNPKIEGLNPATVACTIRLCGLVIYIKWTDFVVS